MHNAGDMDVTAVASTVATAVLEGCPGDDLAAELFNMMGDGAFDGIQACRSYQPWCIAICTGCHQHYTLIAYDDSRLEAHSTIRKCRFTRDVCRCSVATSNGVCGTAEPGWAAAQPGSQSAALHCGAAEGGGAGGSRHAHLRLQRQVQGLAPQLHSRSPNRNLSQLQLYSKTAERIFPTLYCSQEQEPLAATPIS